MSKKRLTSKAADAEYLSNVVNRQMEMLRAYKSRQDDIVQGLMRINRLIEEGNHDVAKIAMMGLLSRDLKQSTERVANWTLALRIAVNALGDHDGASGPVVNRDAVEQIRLLAPEAFEVHVESKTA